MENNSENIVRQLIQVNMERLHLNHEAAFKVRRSERKNLLLGLAAQSEGFIMELEYVLKLYGGSVGSAASQTIKQEQGDEADVLSDHSIFFKVLQYEHKIVEVYNKLLEIGNELDNTLFEKIRSQKSEIMECQLKLNELKN